MGNTPAAARLPAPRDKDPGQLLAVARPHTLAAAPQLTARKLRLAIAGRVGRQTRVLDLDEIAPAIGLGAIEIGEAVLARQPTRRVRAAAAATDVRVGGKRGDRAAHEPRALGDRGEVRIDGCPVAPVR